MKAIFNISFILIISTLFFSCSSEDTSEFEVPEKPFNTLTLSINQNKIHSVEDVDVEFEILSGNGEYAVTSSDEKIAKSRIEGNKVIVNFISNGFVELDITDSREQTAKVRMSIYSKSLIPSSHTLITEKGSIYTIDDLSFGVGDYSLEDIKGTSAEVLIENDILKIKALDHGNTYCKIADKRGTVMDFEVMVAAMANLTSDRLDIEMKRDQRTSVLCLWGKDWKITSPSEACDAVIISNAKPQNVDILQIDTKSDIWGSTSIQLQDKDNNFATVNINIK
ncbi:hypothetical protein [Dysgonomonas termitidis]|jgi:hypothetical protein|uniref:Auto-transporter adhesin head GIN domain-containing protein n=1 Tax=Dysgonomonas termitidis TaxID=1516126 RepID=A0ABV9KWY0_9BACT